jgi:integrase
MAGVDLRTVQELMGHKTQAMTLRYAHLRHGPGVLEREAIHMGTGAARKVAVERAPGASIDVRSAP